MDEKLLKEMFSTLQDIQGRLSVGSMASFRGPVADPAPWFLLSKEKLAQIKIKQIESAITQLKNQMNSMKLECDLLKEEYKIK